KMTSTFSNGISSRPFPPSKLSVVIPLEFTCHSCRKQMVAKKDYKSHHQCARRSRRKPPGECVHTRFADGVRRQTSFRIYSSPSAALISGGIRKCIRSVGCVPLFAVKALKIFL